MAVEPPSPTEGSPTLGFAERHQRSELWKEDQSVDDTKDLHRTKTMPARRARSSTDVADGLDSNHHQHHHGRRRSPAGTGTVDGEIQTRRASSSKKELLNPASLGDEEGAEDNDDDDDVPRTSCRIYRVRSFTTKKGGSVVNRGDSIKICGGGLGRRGSQILITPTNDYDLAGGRLQAPSQPSSVRRRSVTCLPSTSGPGSRPQPEVVSIGVSHSRRHSFIIRPSSAGDGGGSDLGRRTSLRGNERRPAVVHQQQDRGVAYRVELTVGQNNLRRSSVDRLTSADAADQPPARDDDALDDTGSHSTNVEADFTNEDEEEDEEENVVVYKVMVMGSHGVGKTTLVQQLLTSEYLANADDDRGQFLACQLVRSLQQ